MGLTSADYSDKKSYSDLLERGNRISGEIKNNFSFIGNEEIKIIIEKVNHGSAEAKRYPSKGNKIIIDSDKLQNVSDFELRGLFSHEIAHLESYSEMNWLQLGVFAIRYSVSDAFKKKVERETDVASVEKGFGKELLAFREYRLKTASKDDKKTLIAYYLSPEEIKKLEKGQST